MSTPILALRNGTYYATWTANRRSMRKSFKTADKATAERAFANWLLMNGSVSRVDMPPVTMADCWAYYSAHHVAKLTDPMSVEHCWRKLEPWFWFVQIRNLRPASIDAYVRNRTQTVAPATVRKELQMLLAMLRFCAAPPQSLFPASLIPAIKLPDASPPRDRWLKLSEVQDLLDSAAAMRVGDRLSRVERFIWIALETAARVGAILDLTWDRVDFDTNTIHFDVPGARRTKKRRAAVTISTALRPVMLRAYDERTGDRVLDTDVCIWAGLKAVAERAGVRDVSPHVLRHTAATHMARRGVPLFTIAKVLGNSVGLVERVYAKWAPGDAAGSVDMISGGALEMSK